MKKRLILATIAAFAVSGAGAQPQQPSKKVLVAYFSHSGNTREVARQIGEATGGDLFEIRAEKEYPRDYKECTLEAQKELRAGARPKLAEIPDLSAYDTVFLGYPNWWGTMPMPVHTFLESADFRPQNDKYSTVTTSIQTMVESVVSGTSPEDAMTQYATDVARAVGDDNVTEK